VTSRDEVGYRLELARGFLEHAEGAFTRGVFFACADAAQRAAENAAKALVALVEPPSKTHAPADRLAILLRQGALSLPAGVAADELVASVRALGPELHIEAGYGSEDERLAPWETIDSARAREALEGARLVVGLCERVATAAGDRSARP
jgi:HEPN domain-containing protein